MSDNGANCLRMPIKSLIRSEEFTHGMGKPESKSFLKVKAEKNYKCENAKMLQNIFSYNYIHIKVYICILLQM